MPSNGSHLYGTCVYVGTAHGIARYMYFIYIIYADNIFTLIWRQREDCAQSGNEFRK